MSRSFRKSPFCGHTTAESDKWHKIFAHRKERRAVRSALDSGMDIPHPKQYGNPYASMKDGKQRFRADKYPHLMRK